MAARWAASICCDALDIRIKLANTTPSWRYAQRYGAMTRQRHQCHHHHAILSSAYLQAARQG